MSDSGRVFGVLGLFDTPEQLLAAITEVKGRVEGRLDAYMPYPVHGIDEALGLRKSPVGGMVFVMGLLGAIGGVAFELWTSGVDYPLTTAGKPYFSWEAFVPIMFEVMVLFATFTAGLGMLVLLNRLPFLRHPMLRAKSLPSITKDKFALAVEADRHPFDAEAVSAVLRAAGAQAIEVVEHPAPTGPVSPRFLFRVAFGIGISCLVAGYLTYWGVKLFPIERPMIHMLDQPRLDPQRASGFFADGFGMRMPVEGTVARGSLPYTVGDDEDAPVPANPLPRTKAVLERGRKTFDTYCSVCHGLLGNGETSLTAAYGAKPANLLSDTIRNYPDGRIYHVIMKGRNAMPSYAADLNEDERWSVIHYIRVLERAMNAHDSDLPGEVRK